ncbi:hypothetical protein [Nakamurella sp. PAMC28650]|uniref:hypothetical protein n=1 Tax=Nakamurella sp. PAMC28650 TaxID=2762325 RepID=UPI00164E064D|nr:hypothetical protein [Nakamurella sp. PAMC28650]QNK80866.1 hypothetical protein H7F38_22655 [Nakamurella sp. PAMC28650]
MRKPIAWTLAAVALVAILVAAVVVGVRALGSSGNQVATSECTVPAAGPSAAGAASVAGTASATAVPVYLSAVQLQHASTINAVGMSRGLPQRARIIALATAFQESGLRNLPSGDRDSLGLFQQRPSQGWGRPAQIMDPVYAAGKFYDALEKVQGWPEMSLTRAAQSVQYSGFPDAYAKWEGQATTLAIALGGADPLEVTCTAGAQAPTADAPARKALAGAAAAPALLSSVLAAAQAELGGLTLVRLIGSTAVVTVTAPGVTSGQAGRALAAWAVAHATGFTITEVAVEAQGWTAHAWATTTTPTPAGQVTLTAG